MQNTKPQSPLCLYVISIFLILSNLHAKPKIMSGDTNFDDKGKDVFIVDDSILSNICINFQPQLDSMNTALGSMEGDIKQQIYKGTFRPIVFKCLNFLCRNYMFEDLTVIIDQFQKFGKCIFCLVIIRVICSVSKG